MPLDARDSVALKGDLPSAVSAPRHELRDNTCMDVPSPCIDICTLDGREVCVGCGRHIDEIVAWGSAAPEWKLRVVEAARQRLAQMQPPAAQGAVRR
jgi:predicted Fe-S protein YdhL (DUF1289 family)